MKRSAWRTLAVLGAAPLGLATLLWAACTVPNPSHCVNQADPGNTWCAARYPARPFCSPCRQKYNGCVETEPLTCETYDRDAFEFDTD